MSYLETENKSELDTEVAKNTEKVASASSYVWRYSLAFTCCGVVILKMIDMLSSGLPKFRRNVPLQNLITKEEAKYLSQFVASTKERAVHT